ncbi:MAG TPA: glutamine-hydrolyzing carbamoyl-phosphate synthase small subunit [Candidatus Krumholzibacteria bacterium]|nr:glutamine-hydrolyzing carbamoyl-phosphate synthase small subunit [Candidatus Krumholzibacteria bacterium]
MDACIALETGRVFPGRLIGAPTGAGGEVVFHTGMTGYQEILTDPSYAGQIVVFTASHIGNYGIHAGESESAKLHPTGVVIRDFCRRSYHRRRETTLDEVLRRAGVPAIADVDTRALTVAVRDGGTCRGFIGAGDPDALVARARALPPIESVDWVARVTTKEPYRYAQLPQANAPCEVAVLDCGVKQSILHRLAAEGCRVRVFPAHTPAADLLARPTEGVFLSNGPGDPASQPQLVDTVRRVLDSGLPVFGICLGHQLMARALGAETIKLPFGHHGANHPVRNLATGRVEITSQNHNYAVPDGSLDPAVARVTHRSLNDGSVEGLEVPDRPVYSVQYHPEAAPGPSDSLYLFRRFREAMLERRGEGEVTHAAQG